MRTDKRACSLSRSHTHAHTRTHTHTHTHTHQGVMRGLSDTDSTVRELAAYTVCDLIFPLLPADPSSGGGGGGGGHGPISRELEGWLLKVIGAQVKILQKVKFCYSIYCATHCNTLQLTAQCVATHCNTLHLRYSIYCGKSL